MKSMNGISLEQVFPEGTDNQFDAMVLFDFNNASVTLDYMQLKDLGMGLILSAKNAGTAPRGVISSNVGVTVASLEDGNVIVTSFNSATSSVLEHSFTSEEALRFEQSLNEVYLEGTDYEDIDHDGTITVNVRM